ncbi:MAG: DUF3408 domain-containing protein, partial [Rikenellaceae bacterium]
MLEENVMFSQQNQQSETTAQTKSTQTNEPTKRTTQRQRKESMAEYRQMFLTTPKIVDRQTVFIGRDLRDKIDRVVRQIGDRKLSVSGFAQNVLQHHLEMYGDDIDRWRKM